MFSFFQKNKIIREFLYQYACYLPVVFLCTLILVAVTFLLKNNITNLVRIWPLVGYALFHTGITLLFVLVGNRTDVRDFLQDPFVFFKQFRGTGDYLLKTYSNGLLLTTLGLFVLACIFTAWGSAAMIGVFFGGLLFKDSHLLDLVILSLFGLMAVLALSFPWGYTSENVVFIIIPLVFARLVKSF